MKLEFTLIRRAWLVLAGALAILVTGFAVGEAHAKDTVTREIVSLQSEYPAGSIVVDTGARNLYYTLGNGHAIKYRVAVGKPDFQWFGQTFVQRKRKNPSWSPTARMRRLGYPRYVPPGPRNPLGVRAIYLGWTEYRIHGTTAPSSIGRAASSGCIRMHNDDVVDLFDRVHIGAPVYVVKSMSAASTKTAMNN